MREHVGHLTSFRTTPVDHQPSELSVLSEATVRVKEFILVNQCIHGWNHRAAGARSVKGGPAMIDIAVMLFVAAVLVVVLYGVVRPFTHVHYRHPSESQWRPLD
jgi:uncharacterized membrane protein